MIEKQPPKRKITLGRAENITFPVLDIADVPARVDTGAKLSAIWASAISEKNGVLRFRLFDEGSSLFTGEMLETTSYEQVPVTSSNGQTEERYKVRLVIRLHGRRINARFTLADRSTQVYPILLGRNVLRGKFIVDVQTGEPLYQEGRQRSQLLKSNLTPRG